LKLKRTILHTVVCLLVASATVPAWAASQGKPPSARELARQANEKWRLDHDADGALKLFNRAVETAPGDGWVLLQRAGFYEAVAGMVVGDQVEAIRRAARADYHFVATSNPNSVEAGVARDGLARLDGRNWFPGPDVTCPEDADSAFANAEALFASGRFEESLSSYATAAEKCPDSSTIWMSFADAYFQTGRLEDAERIFRKALAVNPWDRASHRFLVETEYKLGHPGEALRQAALAVVSDPGYEAAWATLRNIALGNGRAYLRVYGEKTAVTREKPGADGKPRITITIPRSLLGASSGDKSHDSEAGGDTTESGGAVSTTTALSDASCWLVYGGAKALLLGEGPKGRKDARNPTPFQQERHAVESVLGDFEPNDGAPFWSMMARARSAGFMDEAIYVHLLDRQLVPEYKEFRAQHLRRLVQYLLTVVVPKRTAGS